MWYMFDMSTMIPNNTFYGDNMVYTLEYQLLDDDGNQLDEGGLNYTDLKRANQAVNDVEYALRHVVII